MAGVGGVRAGGGGGGWKEMEKREKGRRKEEHSSHCVTGERGGHRGDTSVMAARTEGWQVTKTFAKKKNKNKKK